MFFWVNATISSLCIIDCYVTIRPYNIDQVSMLVWKMVTYVCQYCNQIIVPREYDEQAT